MSAVTVVGGALLFGITVYLIGAPLLKKEQTNDLPLQQWEKKAGNEGRQSSVFSTLAEIEFDYQMGKLADADYQELRQQYQGQAVEILKNREESHQAGKARTRKEIEAEIEEELDQELAEIRKQMCRKKQG